MPPCEPGGLALLEVAAGRRRRARPGRRRPRRARRPGPTAPQLLDVGDGGHGAHGTRPCTLGRRLAARSGPPVRRRHLRRDERVRRDSSTTPTTATATQADGDDDGGRVHVQALTEDPRAEDPGHDRRADGEAGLGRREAPRPQRHVLDEDADHPAGERGPRGQPEQVDQEKPSARLSEATLNVAASTPNTTPAAAPRMGARLGEPAGRDDQGHHDGRRPGTTVAVHDPALPAGRRHRAGRRPGGPRVRPPRARRPASPGGAARGGPTQADSGTMNTIWRDLEHLHQRERSRRPGTTPCISEADQAEGEAGEPHGMEHDAQSRCGRRTKTWPAWPGWPSAGGARPNV